MREWTQEEADEAAEEFRGYVGKSVTVRFKPPIFGDLVRGGKVLAVARRAGYEHDHEYPYDLILMKADGSAMSIPLSRIRWVRD